ncbi:MAG: leucine-rich repeat domain-containing protein, partial [Fibromonadales bacterium]|nr:leucine-rich repeat domain-containing protein [Fibromonadales bacterium]
QNCYTTGTVTGTNRVGGLVGEFDKASVTNSYSTAAVNGNSEVGGLVGNVGFLSISITNCAALNAEVNGSSNVGRIMNDEHGDATLSNSFAYSGLPGTDGTDITATDIITDGTIGGLFTAPVWTTENGKLPGFGTAVDMPAHITVDIANAAITLNTTSYTYSGTAITPNITVTLGGMELTENTHYSITSNNVNAGGASFSIAGMHPFTGTKAGTFTISKATPSYTIPTGLTTTYGQTLADVSLPAGWSWVNATASVGNPGPQIHKANYNPDPSNYNTITGIDVAITVDLVNLANATITHNATYIYDGSGKVLNITVTLGGMILELGQHYDINSITNNINSGEASFTIEGLYPFTGTKSGTFEIAKGTIGGTVSISGKADFGETLTAVTTGVTPATGACSAHSYQWKRNGIDIPYGTNASYEIDEIHFNDAFTVTVFSSDTNCTGAVTSAATTDIVTVARGKVEGTEWSYNGGDTLYISGSGNITWTAASHWSRYSNSIKTVIIGNGLTSIVVYAFGGFSNLTDLVIPDGVVIIYDEACYGCSSLKSITIPGSVTQINSEAFYNCSSLEEAIFLGDAPTDFSKINVFGNTASNFKIYYYVGTSGWTTPTWNGYPTEMLKYAAPSAPGAPTLVSKTHNTITLEANASHEFSKDGTTWQTSNVFSSLSSSTAHTFYQRIAETATNYASAASVALNETTTAKPDPAYTIPTGLTAKEGQKLSEITLPPNWHWMNETESVGTPGTQTHKAKFVPEDTENYNTIENIDVKITVSKELVLIPTTSHSPLATSQPPKYYTLKGTPLGTTKPTAPGVYIVKIGTQTNKIMVK